MFRLSQLDFCVLNAVADGSEPFSMIYQDVMSSGQVEWDMKEIVRSVCNLMSSGMLELCETEISDEPILDFDKLLLDHYDSLDKELQEVGKPFYYSRGEYFFQMTETGKEEWQKEEYRPFYASWDGQAQ
jgi:hypothetical protein